MICFYPSSHPPTVYTLLQKTELLCVCVALTPLWMSLHDKYPVWPQDSQGDYQGNVLLLWHLLVRMDAFPIAPQSLWLVQERANKRSIHVHRYVWMLMLSWCWANKIQLFNCIPKFQGLLFSLTIGWWQIAEVKIQITHQNIKNYYLHILHAI